MAHAPPPSVLNLFYNKHVLPIAEKRNVSTTSPILPPGPPPFLPPPAIEHVLAKFDIDSVMRLAHPPPKLFATADPRRISVTAHPLLEVPRAVPAWVQLREGRHESAGLRLQGRRGVCGVRAGYRVQQGPRGAAELFDIWGAIGGVFGHGGGWRRCGFGGGFCGRGALGHCEERGDVGAGTASTRGPC